MQIEKIQIELLNGIYTVFYNDDIYGSYSTNVIALAICNGLTGLAYTDVNEYKVTNADGKEYTQKEIFDLQNGSNSLFYTVSGVIDQAGTADPSITINQNDTGNTYAITRINVGQYSLDKDSPAGPDFAADNEIFFSPITNGMARFSVGGQSTLQIDTVDMTQTYADDLLIQTAFLIRIPK